MAALAPGAALFLAGPAGAPSSLAADVPEIDARPRRRRERPRCRWGRASSRGPTPSSGGVPGLLRRRARFAIRCASTARAGTAGIDRARGARRGGPRVGRAHRRPRSARARTEASTASGTSSSAGAVDGGGEALMGERDPRRALRPGVELRQGRPRAPARVLARPGPRPRRGPRLALARRARDRRGERPRRGRDARRAWRRHAPGATATRPRSSRHPERALVDRASPAYERGASLFFGWLDATFGAEPGRAPRRPLGPRARRGPLSTPIAGPRRPRASTCCASRSRTRSGRGRRSTTCFVRFAVARATMAPPARLAWHVAWPAHARRLASPRARGADRGELRPGRPPGRRPRRERSCAWRPSGKTTAGCAGSS